MESQEKRKTKNYLGCTTTFFILSVSLLSINPPNTLSKAIYTRYFVNVQAINYAYKALGINTSLDDLNAITEFNKGEVSFYDIKTHSLNNGLKVEAVRTDFKGLKELVSISDTCILVSLSKNRQLSVVKETTNESVKIHNPASLLKELSLPVMLFEKDWDGRVLILSKNSIKSILLDVKGFVNVSDDSLKSIFIAGAGCGNTSGSGGSYGNDSRWSSGNGSSNYGDPHSSDPVNLRDGNVAITVTDLTTSTRGLPLSLTRFYNSQVISEVTGWLPEPGAGSWVIEDAEYSGEGDRTTTDLTWKDFDLSLDMQTITAGVDSWQAARIDFRYVDGNNHYYFLIHKDGKLDLVKYSQGAQYYLTSKTSSISPYVTHNIRIQMTGGVIKIYVDSQLKLSYTDTNPLPEGRIVLEANFSHCHFDNVSITGENKTLNSTFDTDDNSFLFGYGWSHNYSARIIEYQDHITLIRENGYKQIYAPNGDGSYYSVPYKTYDTLIKDASGWLYTTKHGTKYRFDLAGRLKYLEDRNGNQTTINYQDESLLIQNITAPDSRQIVFSYIPEGFISSITDSAGGQIQYAYDSYGNLISVTDRRGNAWQYSYDSTNHNLISLTDPQANTYSYSYWYNDRILAQTDPQGNTLTFDYLWSYNAVINSRSEVYYYGFDNNEFLQSITDPAGKTETMYNDANGNITNYYDKVNNHTYFTYDNNGNRSGIYDANNNWATFSYETTYNQPTSIKNARGYTTSFEYDNKGNLIKITDALNNKTTFTYNFYGKLETKADPKGNITSFSYDDYGNLTSVIDALGNVTTYTYDILGRIKSVNDAQENATQYSYDSNGNLSSVTDALSNYTFYIYDANNRLSLKLDPLWHTTSYTYDSLGNLIEVKDAKANTTSYSYDTTNQLHLAHSNLSLITDAGGNITNYKYDSLDRLIQTQDALGNSFLYGYDAQGNLTSRIDSKNQTTTYNYDKLNRLYKINYPNSSYIEYTLDAVGNITKVKDSSGQTSYTFDALNRVTALTYPNAVSLTYTYDENSNKKSLSVSGAGTINYTYDELNRLSSITDLQAKITTFSYDSLSRRENITLPNNIITSYAYDETDRLLSLTHQSPTEVISQFVYTYDKADRRTNMTTLDNSISYGYDEINQLTNVTQINGNTINYEYDKAGNRLFQTKNNTQTVYSYNNLNQLTQTKFSLVELTLTNKPLIQLPAQEYIGSESLKNISQLQTINYSYDANGNLTQQLALLENKNYQYDYENRLNSFNSRDISASYTYDGFGRRVSKTVNGVTTSYYYDFNEVILEKTGTETLFYLHGPRIDEIIARYNPATQEYTYYHTDGLGSITQITDNSGQITENYTYDAFGTVTNNEGQEVNNQWLFTGRQFDPESGLYFYRNRYYDAKVGRFITQDPSLKLDANNIVMPYLLLRQIANPLDLQKYLYCTNDPVNLVDPFGLESGQNGSTGPDWGTVGWGITEIASGVTGLATAIGISTATGGMSTLPTGWLAYTSILSIGTGVADVMSGIYGGSTVAELVSDALEDDPLGRRITHTTTELLP